MNIFNRLTRNVNYFKCLSNGKYYKNYEWILLIVAETLILLNALDYSLKRRYQNKKYLLMFLSSHVLILAQVLTQF